MVSDGGTRPYRVHYRDPSFTNLQAVAAMCEGGMVADVIVAVASHRPGDGRGGPVTTLARDGDRRACWAAPDEPGRRSAGRSRTRPRCAARLDADAAEIIARYPQPRSALLPLLHLVQAEDGYVTPAGIAFCAEQLA